MYSKLPQLCIVALAVLAGCTKLKRGRQEDLNAPVPEKPVAPAPLEAQKSTLGIITLAVELRSDGMLLKVGNVPDGASLDCDRGNEPLVPCHDGALFTLPPEGDHKVSAVAMKDGVPVAFGESAPFTVLPGTGGAYETDGDPRHTLMLVSDDPAFVNGMTVPLSKDFKTSFKLAGKPNCEHKIRCSYDSRTSRFWTECDVGDTSYTVPKELLAVGIQFLSVQASCGERVGPALSLFWFGVPDDYAPLMLRAVRDPQGRQIVELLREEDCKEGLARKYECAAPGSDEFDACTDSNVFDKPAQGLRVRLSCAGTFGPALALEP